MTLHEGTLERAGLSELEAGEVRALLRACQPVDVNIILDASEGHQLLRYQGRQLVGVLGLRHDGEAGLCVAPSARRQGIGRALIAAADARLARAGITEMVVESDASSAEGKAFLHALQATARAAELRLRLATSRPPEAARSIRLERVEPPEIAAFMKATATSFGDPTDARYTDFVRQVVSTRYRFYRAAVGATVVGGLRATFYDAETHLTSFHTLPEQRGRGYGRDLLLQTCQALLAESSNEIVLEVRTDNEAALKLYLSCGFEVVCRYDYYVRRVVASALTG